MKLIRWLLGKIILVLNAITAPKPKKRTPEQQSLVNKESENLTLYQYEACPFCVKVRRNLRRQNVTVKLVNAKQEDHKQALINGGGKLKVPCLQIIDNKKITWLYESDDINAFINDKFSTSV